MPDSVEWRRLVAAVKVAARAPFVEGAPKLELLELYRDVGAAQLIEWLPEAPSDHGVPRLVAWLSDQRYRPDSELIERLEARAQAEAEAEAAVIASGDLGATTGGMGDAPDRPRLAEYVPPVVDPDAPRLTRDELRALREQATSTPSDSQDDRMTTSTGGT